MTGPANDRPRITAEAIAAEQPEHQRTGERYCEMVLTSFTVAETPPYGRMQVVSFLTTLLGREPMKSDPIYAHHRAVLGALIIDLQGYAIRDAADGVTLAPDPVTDMRNPAIIARERQYIRATQEWATAKQERSAADYSAYLDREVLDAPAVHELAQQRLDAAAQRAQAWLDGERTPEAFNAQMVDVGQAAVVESTGPTAAQLDPDLFAADADTPTLG